MAGFRRMMSYLGLVDDDEYDEYDPYEEQQPARQTRPVLAQPDPVEASTVRTIPREAAMEQPSGVTVTPRSSVVRPIMPTASSKPQTVTPTSFNDVTEIGDRLKAGTPVIVNLQGTPRELTRRIVDFASGLSYGLGAEMERTADGVYLLTPQVRG